MKIILTVLVLTLLTAQTTDKNLKRILKDGQFSKFPKSAKILGHEIILDSKKRFGYLTLDLINNGEISRETLVISGTLIGVGLIGKLLIGNRIKIRGRTKLRILKL